MERLWEQHDGDRLRTRTVIEQQLLQSSYFESRSLDLIRKLADIYANSIQVATVPVDTYLTQARKRLKESNIRTSPLSKAINGLQVSIYQFIQLAATLLQEMTFRLAALSVSWITAFLLGSIGFVDGLVRRDIRRWSGGRESSRVYSGSRRLMVPLSTIYTILVVAWPWTLHIKWFVAVYALTMGVLLTVASSRFKKYL